LLMRISSNIVFLLEMGTRMVRVPIFLWIPDKGIRG